MFPALNHHFQGSFFSKGAVVSFGAFWFKYRPRPFTYSNPTRKKRCKDESGWSQESTEAYPYWDSPRFSLWQLFVCFYVLFFKKCPINGRLRLKLPGPCTCCTSTSASCFRGGSNTEPSHSTEEHLERKNGSINLGVRWMHYPRMVIPSPHGCFKKKAQATSVSERSLPICSCQFSFQLRRVLYQQTGDVERTHIFQEATNVCCRCFQSPPPFHWATLTVKTKPLASAPARPKSACSWSSDRPYLVDPSKHCRVRLERFRGGGIEIVLSKGVHDWSSASITEVHVWKLEGTLETIYLRVSVFLGEIDVLIASKLRSFCHKKILRLSKSHPNSINRIQKLEVYIFRYFQHLSPNWKQIFFPKSHPSHMTPKSNLSIGVTTR